MFKKISAIFAGAFLVVLASSWGWVGHYNISYRASLSFNSEMSAFSVWTQTLADSASVPDDRKSSDPSESAKHYIDIDNYTEFNQNGYISQVLATVIAQHGSNVSSWGILPWATIASFDSLKSCFQRLDLNKALFYACDLGHYVADGHMPMHITKNYDGAETGNSGIHSRYESTMIGANISQITYTGDPISQITDVPSYIFSYIYENHRYVDSVLIADNAAKAINSSYNSTAYKAELWNRSKNFTILLFKNASHALAELIYTAWAEAGKPDVSTTAIATPQLQEGVSLSKNSPNPFSDQTTISYSLPRHFDTVLITVTDMSGKTMTTLCNEAKEAGTYQVIVNSAEFTQGIYVVTLKADNVKIARKMILLKK
jgi:hypothetical protein